MIGVKIQSLRENGIATLEAAASFLLLIPMIMGLCSAVEVATQSSELNAIVDKELYDTGVSPLRLEYNGTHGVQVDHARLIILAQSVADATQQELERVRPQLSFTQFRIEVGYSELAIDEQSGVSTGYRVFPHTHLEVRGALHMPSEVDHKIAIENQLQSIEQLVLPSGTHTYAAPTLHYSDMNASFRFLDSVVVLSAKVAVSIEDSFVGETLDLIGSFPFLYASKVIVLRGDVSS